MSLFTACTVSFSGALSTGCMMHLKVG